MNNQFLLIEDIDELGRSGDLVKVKPGYARNYLLPQKKAVVATAQTLRMQEQLKAERAKRAVQDKKEAETLAKSLEGKVLNFRVKVDQEGHMYGSVAVVDIVHLFEKEGIQLTRRNVLLAQPIKTLGVHEINLKLKEGVPAKVILEIEAEEAPQL